MFTARSYDFGNIARGAKTEIAFELTNLYLEDVHIAGVQSSCGCTTPRIEKDTLKTYEKGAIIAHINSDRFLGNRGATISVTIDKPLYAEVQLYVKVHIYETCSLNRPASRLGALIAGIPLSGRLRPVHRPKRLANHGGQERQPAPDGHGEGNLASRRPDYL